jgi:hypothetical protein
MPAIITIGQKNAPDGSEDFEVSKEVVTIHELLELLVTFANMAGWDHVREVSAGGPCPFGDRDWLYYFSDGATASGKELDRALFDEVINFNQKED